mmetsp:Transcript_1214/g.1859  ORF Transcript_1214/g.1859 Transcript_1214/m.1859 type:complete len:198 (-) Transcript_1214:1127-1720(-)
MSCKDIKRRKCQFCLSFCSVFVVVLSVLAVVTITALGPIIFLRINEKQTGEVDAIFSNRITSIANFPTYSDQGNYLNYTAVKERIAEVNIDANLSPRLQFCGSKMSYTVPNKRGSGTKVESFSSCIGAIDTAREKEISIGTDYPFKPLGPGECLVPIDLEADGVEIGDEVDVYLTMGSLLKAMAAEYNNLTNAEAKN